MTDTTKKVKIKSDRKKLDIVVLSLTIFFFIVILSLIAGWSIIQKKTRKAPLVLESDGSVEPQVYEEDQVNATYASTGYDFSGLQMPCSQEEIKAGLPNLPESYRVTNCDSLSKRICVDNYVKGGGICLSTLGGVCGSLYDCASGANACINNICVNTVELDTINQPCVTDYECSVEGQNHVCDKKLNICKYNYFPYETGCQIDADCLSSDPYNQNTCIFSESSGLSIEATVGENRFIVTDLKQDNLNFYRKGTTISTVLGNSFILFNITNIVQEGKNKVYDTRQDPSKYYPINTSVIIYLGNTGGDQIGICVSKIPRGGKRISIAGVEIPCEDGLIDSDGFCVLNNFYSTYGIICDKKDRIGALSCEKNFLNKFSKTTELTCLGDVDIQEQFSKNFNYTYPSLINDSSSTAFRDEVKSLGYCSYETAQYKSPCDTNINNCVKPYLCLSSTDQSGNSFSFCGNNLNRQECSKNGDCSKGYNCDQSSICLSNPGNICFDKDDTKDECTGPKYIYYFSLEKQEYTTIGESISGIHIGEDINIRFGKNIDSSTGLPEFFLIWSRNTSVNINRPPDYSTLNGYKNIDETYVGDTLSITTYTKNGDGYTENDSTVNLYPGENVIFRDVLISPDNKLYAIYQTSAVEDRIRRSRVLEIFGDNRFTLPINAGFTDGEKVIYRGTNFSESKTYFIYREGPYSTVQDFSVYKYYLKESESGSVVEPVGDYDNTGMVISYSNAYRLQFPSHSLQENVSPLLGQNFQTGDKLRLKSGELTISLETGQNYTLESGRDVYLKQTSGIESYTTDSNFDRENSYFYQLSDDSNPGSVSFFDDIRMTWQNMSSDSELDIIINPDMISHSITVIEKNRLSQYIVKCESLVDGRRNGINSGFMYNLDSGRIPHFSMEGDRIILTVDIPYFDPSSDGLDSFSFIQELNIVSGEGSGENQLTTGVYTGGSTTTTQFYFTYENTASPPQPRGLYFDQNKKDTENVVSKVFFNPLNQGKTNSLNIISTFTDSQDITVNDDPTVLLSSELQKTSFTSTPGDVSFPPDLKYNNSNLQARYFEIDMIDISTPDININSVNTYAVGQNTLVFRKSREIDLILKYGWSELVFMKVKEDISPPSDINVDYESNFFTGNGQIILVSVGILSYDVTIEGEILVVETHVPLNTGDSGPRNEILSQDNNTWRLYPYNIHPLYTKRMILRRENGNIIDTGIYNFFDASGLHTSTKKEDFFPSTGKIKETAYNKIFTTSYANDESGHITVINVHDGFGYLESDEGPYSSKIMTTPNTDTGGEYTIFLPSLVPNFAFENQVNIGNSTNFTDIDKRTDGQITGYFFPVNDRFFTFNLSDDAVLDTTTICFGKSYISQTSDYLFLNNDLNLNGIKYFRPLFSGMIWIKGRGGSDSRMMYGVNNLYMSGIPKSIPTKPYYNLKTTDIYYSISTNGRKKGDINLGIDTYPYYPLISDGIVEDLDQSYEKIVKWPDWILENKLIVYAKNPIIKNIFLSTSGGNIGGKIEYYVQAEIDGKNNLYLFSSSNDRESIFENQGIPTTKNIYEGKTELNGSVFNRQFFTVGRKVSK